MKALLSQELSVGNGNSELGVNSNGCTENGATDSDKSDTNGVSDEPNGQEESNMETEAVVFPTAKSRGKRLSKSNGDNKSTFEFFNLCCLCCLLLLLDDIVVSVAVVAESFVNLPFSIIL